MSAEATGWVWNHSPYRGAELLVHLAIADVVNDAHDNEFWMSTYSLAKKARVSRSTVVAALQDMHGKGLLEVLEAGGLTRKPSRYRFTPGAATDLARSVWPSPLARSPRANSMNPNEIPKEAGAVTDLDPKTPPPWVQFGMTRQEWTERQRENESDAVSERAEIEGTP